jgi:hypothetical protein
MCFGHEGLRHGLITRPVNASLTVLPDDDLDGPVAVFCRRLISRQPFHFRVHVRVLRPGLFRHEPTGITTSDHLAGYGLEIITASSVDEARHLLRTNRRISVLVIDADLGQAHDGLSLAKSARVSDPDLKVIYTSRMPFRLRDCEKVSGAPCVRTPYRPHQLVGVISQLVQRHPTEEAEAYAA